MVLLIINKLHLSFQLLKYISDHPSLISTYDITFHEMEKVTEIIQNSVIIPSLREKNPE